MGSWASLRVSESGGLGHEHLQVYPVSRWCVVFWLRTTAWEPLSFFNHKSGRTYCLAHRSSYTLHLLSNPQSEQVPCNYGQKTTGPGGQACLSPEPGHSATAAFSTRFYKTRPTQEHKPGVLEHICLLWETTSNNIHLNDSTHGNVISPLPKPYD